jgi:hypothetical protein
MPAVRHADHASGVAADPIARDLAGPARAADQLPCVAGDLTPAETATSASALRTPGRPSLPAPPEIAIVIQKVVRLHAEMKFAVGTRVALTNRFAAYIRVRVLGVSTFDGKEALSKAKKETARIRKALATGAPLDIDGAEPGDDETLRVLAAGVDQAVEPFEKIETTKRKQLAKLAVTLPGAAFVISVRGFGMLSFATLVGEAGDIGSYRSHQALWKRLGLAVIQGERQQRKSHALLAEEHGYNPARRAVSWVVFDTLFRGQSTDPPGPYRVIYDRFKERYIERGWVKIHAHNAARRAAGKILVKHLYQAWRRDLRELENARALADLHALADLELIELDQAA